ncbi:MAG: amidohydrolase family protein [Halobacteriales archaeon]|nr:amidohydrolase family protein [Halobacteriales archaeon]
MNHTHGSTAIETGTLLVGTGDVRHDVTVGIEDGTIQEVTNGAPDGDYDRSIDASEQVLMPGLIDAHVHLVYPGDPDDMDVSAYSDEYLSLRGAELVRDALRAGVTTLGDAASKDNAILALRNAIDDGVTLGPRIKACGSMISITGGRATGGEPGGNIVEADGPDEVRKVTRRQLMYHGIDFVKLAATGAISSPHTGARDPQLTTEEMRAAVEEAHNCGRPVHAHCYGAPGIGNALDAGVDVIVHGQSLTDEHLRTMETEDTLFMPTLATFRKHGDQDYDPFIEGDVERDRPESTGGVIAETKPNYKRVLDRDITITMGTDTGMPSVYQGDNADDLVYMVDWGMDPADAIVAGTYNAAKSLAIEETLGSVESGKHADLLLLEDNPLDDITVLASDHAIDRIMLDGRFVEADL